MIFRTEIGLQSLNPAKSQTLQAPGSALYFLDEIL